MGAAAGAFVVLNDEGWIVTAAHVLDVAVGAMTDQPKVAEVRAAIEAVRVNPSHRPGFADREVKRLERSADREWTTNWSYWWSRNGLTLKDVSIIREADLAVGRLEPFPAEMAKNLPVLMNSASDLAPGRSLCRLGFPFTEIKPRYDETTGGFDLGEVQFTFFPLDGIFTRGIDGGTTNDGKHPILFIEISTPGIPGQSGGPVFDVEGNVWGIQSRTHSIALGFSPEIQGRDGRKTVEHQVINLGIAVHPVTLTSILRDIGIKFAVSGP